MSGHHERISVLGASGFVGSALVAGLHGSGREVLALNRKNLDSAPSDLGHAIYAIGMTSDFRTMTLATVTAHVSLLAELIASKSFQSFTYLSSTRLYGRAESTDEAALIGASSLDPDDVYTLSKLLGEAIVLRMVPDRGRVCRLSNVYGPGDHSSNFLTSLIDDGRHKRNIKIVQDAKSEKDYINVADACRAIEMVALRGEEPIYNVASGENTSHQEIADALSEVGLSVSFGTGKLVQFKPIDVGRLQKLMNWKPRRVSSDLPSLVSGQNS